MGSRRAARASGRGADAGAALIEFALVLPVLLMLVFGMITGAIAYNQKLGISASAQQTARFAATLPLSSYDDTDAWLDAVHARVEATSEGALDEGASDRIICVAFVAPDDGTVRSRSVTTSDADVTRADAPCYDDGLPDSEARTQVALSRSGSIDLIVFGTVDLTLAKAVTTRYEVVG